MSTELQTVQQELPRATSPDCPVSVAHEQALSNDYPFDTSSPSSSVILSYENTQITPNQPSLSMLLLDESFCGRIVILLVIIFLCFVTILYAIGQILSLNLTDYWCPSYSLDQVRQNSINLNKPQGISNSCWKSNTFLTVDDDALWSNESYNFQLDVTFKTFMQLLTFTALSICFISNIIYIGYCTYMDIKRFRNNQLGKREYLKQVKSNTNKSINIQKSNMIFAVYHQITTMYKKHFSVDSGKWCLLMIIREFIEICIQSSALLLYNGTYLWTDPFDDDTDIRLAQSAKYVKVFTVFLCCNCITAGILWIFYALKPYLCHGVLFYLILSSFDALFDIFYALFPLIIVFSNKESTIMTTLAALQTNYFAYWVTFIPMLFLMFKFVRLSNKLITDLRFHYAKMYEQQLRQSSITPSTDTKQNKNIITTPIISTNDTISWVVNNTSIIDNNSATSNASDSVTDDLQNYVQNLRSKHLRKIPLLSISIIFIIYGIVIMERVFTHFSFAETYCNKLTDEQTKFIEFINGDANVTQYKFDTNVQDLFDANSELFLFQFCENKVYPFDINGHRDLCCQCRNFRFHQDEFQWNYKELEEYFGVDLVEMAMNIFRKWYMLEKVEFKDVDQVYQPQNPPGFNFTADMFHAKELKVFSFERSPIVHFDDKISNWKALVHFVSHRSGSFEIPTTFNKLIQMKSFINTLNFKLTELPSQLCDLPKLRIIDVTNSKAQTIPFCFANDAPNLESMLLTDNLLKNVPLGLFNMNGLQRLRTGLSQFTIQDLIRYNNLSSETEFNEKFKWNRNTLFYMVASEICFQENNNSLVQQFINETGCCNGACDSILFLESKCGYEWQNGVCDAGCNTLGCHWDGGDCLQLCECLKDETDYKMLGDGHCDKECNTTNCKYDQYDCVTTSNKICNDTYYLGQHECDPDWIGDNWCDGNCQYNSLCDYDGGDCDQHSCDENAGKQCQHAFDTFSILANTKTNDNQIDREELCTFWPVVQSVLNAHGDEDYDYLVNCNITFETLDVNGDGKIKFREVLVTAYEIQDITLEKAEQLNCSRCTGVDDYYD